MLNWKPESVEEYRDVQTIWNYHHSALNKSPRQRLERQWRSCRDNARTPVQWTNEKNGGFTTADTPWMNVNPNYTWLNQAQQAQDPDSIWNFYRKAIRLRKSLSCVRHGSFHEYWPNDRKRYVYTRYHKNQRILVVCSFWDKPTCLPVPKGCDLDAAELILCNVSNPQPLRLSPYEVRVYLWNKEDFQ